MIRRGEATDTESLSATHIAQELVCHQYLDQQKQNHVLNNLIRAFLFLIKPPTLYFVRLVRDPSLPQTCRSVPHPSVVNVRLEINRFVCKLCALLVSGGCHTEYLNRPTHSVQYGLLLLARRHTTREANHTPLLIRQGYLSLTEALSLASYQ